MADRDIWLDIPTWLKQHPQTTVFELRGFLADAPDDAVLHRGVVYWKDDDQAVSDRRAP